MTGKDMPWVSTGWREVQKEMLDHAEGSVRNQKSRGVGNAHKRTEERESQASGARHVQRWKDRGLWESGWTEMPPTLV